MICAVALVLLLDASGSINATEWQQQLEGTADALADARVVRVIERGPGIAVKAIAFDTHTAELLPWRVARTGAEAAAVAAELRVAARPFSGGTAIGAALDAARAALADAPCVPDEHVIDLSTDGEGLPAETEAARDRATTEGIRVNAIGVGRDTATEWLREHAVTPGGFAMSASWSTFAEAMVRKLVLEVASR